MANKILTFSNQRSTVKTVAPTYIDVSLTADYADTSMLQFLTEPVYLSDYYQLLVVDPLIDDLTSALMWEDSTISTVDLSDLFTVDDYVDYLLTTESVSPTAKSLMLSSLDKLSSNAGDSSYLTPSEIRLLLQNYDLSRFNVDLPPAIKVFGVELRAGYEDAIRRYKLYLEKSKYRIGTLTDIAAILNSVMNLFSWTKGERILLPEYGTDLRRYLYNGITQENSEQIIAEIKGSLAKWEPRVLVELVVNTSTAYDTDDNTIHLLIVYSIPSISTQRYSYTYSYVRS